MKELSKVASQVQASTTLAVDALAKQMKADGLDVIGFGTGEPDFDTPENIKEAAIKAIRSGETKYTPAAGLVPLRKAAAQRLKADCGVDYAENQIVIASGAKHNIFAALMALINPGDEVIVPAPYWVTYTEAIKMAGGVPVVVYADEKAGFKITAAQLEKAVTDKTKLFILNNPSNPTGMLYNREELRSLADVCVRHDLYIISDEIYYRLVYDNGEFVSVAALGEAVKERTIIVNGVSKSYAMTGWRIGFTASSKEIATVMANYLSHSTSAPSTISQYAALEALNGPQDTVDHMRDVFQERRDYIVGRVNAMEGVSCLSPEGAFYIMLNISKLKGKTLGGRVINNGDDFSLAFLEKGLVAAVSCVGFGAPDFVRFTYATSMENIKEGMDRLEKFLKS
ncbi:aspartate aminotransferase [Sporobacter termitidis DSM 10068]|uniref:Aminotransferase n=1 Tax=Sporobacter termitidis DSM 10068 TaxID=1123282 RepID=A0A1M5TS31_9FIRM|nr:pyridoxal phosphate-dependent aminotransferase [Sporobacter termitidis]SHH53478.1 aspartate aminotransferase [Sporobacter termitidis DSM 10068]